jgi:hypothetical protein
LTNPLIVFEPAAIVLFVRVSVVARPTRVSVAAGRVRVVVPAVAVATTVVVPEVDPLNTAPVLPIVGRVKVLLVRVCVPVRVATVESIAIVTAALPLKDVPERPVPIVRAFVVFAVIVIAAEPLNDTPLIFLAVARVVAVDALPVKAPTKVVEVTDVKPASVVAVDPRLTAVEPIVTPPVAHAGA